MSRGKHLSLEEARKQGKLKEFIKERGNPKADKKRFEGLLDKMSKGEIENNKNELI